MYSFEREYTTLRARRVALRKTIEHVRNSIAFGGDVYTARDRIMIREAVETGLQRHGWAYEDAALFAVAFVEQVAQRMSEIADAAATSH